MKQTSKFLALFHYHNQPHWPTAPHAKVACPHTQKTICPWSLMQVYQCYS